MMVFLNKQGVYKKQYVNNVFGKALDMVVYDGKIFVLIEKAIMSFSL